MPYGPLGSSLDQRLPTAVRHNPDYGIMRGPALAPVSKVPGTSRLVLCRRHNSLPPSAATGRQDAGMPAMPSGTVRNGTVHTASSSQ